MNNKQLNSRPVTLLQRLAFTLVMALLLATFLWLAFWQLDRAEFKQSLLDAADTAPTLTVAQIQADSPRFARIHGAGHYDNARSFLLDNQVEGGIVGVHLYTPFQLPGGQWIMVNRGWLAMALDRKSLPVFTTPTGLTNISGRLNLPPGTGVRLGGSEKPAKSALWPKLVTYLELDQLEAELGISLLPLVIQLDKNSTSGYGARQLRPLNFGPEKHKGYAITWFSFAIVAIILYLVIIPMGRKPEHD